MTWGKRDLGNVTIPIEDGSIVLADLGSVEQTSTELFYRIQLTQEVHVTPSLQVIFDPVLNPDKDRITVLGIRGRAEF